MTRLAGRLPVAGLLLFAAAAALTPAQEGPSPAEEEVRRRASQVAEITAKQAGILDRLELSRQKVRFSESVLRSAQEKRASFERSIADGRRRIAELELQEKASQQYLAARMRQRYALGLLQEYRVVFAAASTQDMKDAALYLAALAKEDQRQIQLGRDTRRQLAEARRSMEERRAYLDRVEEQARAERALLREEQRGLADLLRQVASERSTAQGALDELLAASERLDRTLEDLALRKRAEMATRNMADSRGKLPFPARGKISAGFGDTVHPRFKTRVPHPGLDIEAAEDAPVKAVYDGEVSFAGWLSGYGYAVIVNHPGGYFTVYAHLDQILARQGNAVTQGETLATAGSGRPVYFELRQGGQAVNPLPWLKAEPRAPKRGRR